MIKRVALFFVFLIVFSCGKKESEDTLPQSVGLDINEMDTTVNPADDFYNYVNGGWMDRTNIPATEGRWGSFNELRERTLQAIYMVMKEAEAGNKHPEGSDYRKAIDFFAVGMDSAQAETLGNKPLLKYFDQINAIKTRDDLRNYLQEQQKIDGGAFFSLFIRSDMKKSDQVALYIGSGGLGLPERDYYILKDEKSRETREKYRQHVARMLELSGVEKLSAQQQAQAVMDIETRLANSMMTKENRRDPDKIYNKRSLAQLSQLVPSVSWHQYVESLGIKDVDSLIVTDIAFMTEVERIIGRGADSGAIKSYLRWHLVNSASPYLSHQYVNEDFNFYSKYLRGIDEMKPRWKRVLGSLDEALGEAVGQLYVAKNFPPEAKKKAEQMVENIKMSFAGRIKELDWMSDSTKQKALNKLRAFNVKIGYPDEWRDYAGLLIERHPERSSYVENVWNSARFTLQREVSKLGKPVDRKEWLMSPQTVNAYYNPLFNEIVFPAAILQPPFYNYQADEAVNYGGIGAVIGHEISHGFDDQGSKFDGEGNLKKWWSDEDFRKFKEKGKALADQYSKYEPLPGIFVQGEFTLGENIGDLGGVAMAYDGLQRYMREKGRPGLIDGFTPEQRFFISWATIWRTKTKDETMRTLVMTDPHSPGIYRAIGPLSNIPEFYDAFGVSEGTKLYRPEAERVKIW